MLSWDRPWLFCVDRSYTGAVPGLVFHRFACVSKVEVCALLLMFVLLVLFACWFVRRR
jgi:hypothetical protein